MVALAHSDLADAELAEAQLADAEFAYLVRRSDRARRVRVTVDRGGNVEVVLPRRLPQCAAQEAVVELRPWIERRLAEVGRQRAAVLARGDTVPYLGASLAVVGEAGRTRVTRRRDTLVVPEGLKRQAALERWYRRMAREEIRTRLDRACAEAQLSYMRLTIRDQRTRWGSCSRAGAMSFNWRLLLAPEAVLDYVIWHEVCHLEVMDHSPRFWALVARRCPEHREHAAWLKRNAATLVI
ncbi:MAG TPA: SprT family zinc-dependent metalloprotease [Solirubrobacteraceae bacterium]|nr:SprT family zinc-dependent metalloprotease [Solirubrobacteraceae bacterium]